MNYYHCMTVVLCLSIIRSCDAGEGGFAECMSVKNSLSRLHSPSSSSYSSLLQSAQQNPRWLNSTSAPRPRFIVTPTTLAEIQAAVVCSRKHGMQVRVKSGGHDYEGLSYLCYHSPFIVIDLDDFRSVSVDLEGETAWVQSGATLGELYYTIAKESGGSHGFSAGLYPSVGVGGHFSGGGIGTMMRKHGLAADNVVDARLVDVNGRILDRKTMGEDLFWAIRGGGGASFGVIAAWKVRLVRVPPLVTVFSITLSPEQGIKLVHRWQFIAPKLPKDLVKWGENRERAASIQWIRTLHDFMRPYVSSSPRAAYVNYRDLDICSIICRLVFHTAIFCTHSFTYLSLNIPS